MRKINVFIICLLSASLVHAQVDMNAEITPKGTISAQPMRNDFRLRAGESQEVKILISNRMEKKMQFNVYLSDWRRDTMGMHVYSTPGTERQSCAKWITLDKTFLEVDTASYGTISLKLQIPDSADAVKEMKWAMLFVETIRESKAPVTTGKMKSEIVPNTRFGIHIYQTPPLVLQKELKLYSFASMENNPDVFRLVCENTGKVQLNCKSYIELSSIADSKKITGVPIEVPLFPGQKRYIDYAIPANTPNGKYTMVGIVDPGAGMDIEAAQLVVNVHE
jgi:hypothetical protein